MNAIYYIEYVMDLSMIEIIIIGIPFFIVALIAVIRGHRNFSKELIRDERKLQQSEPPVVVVLKGGW